MFQIGHQSILTNLNNFKFSKEAHDPNPIPDAGRFCQRVHRLIIGRTFRPRYSPKAENTQHEWVIARCGGPVGVLVNSGEVLTGRGERHRRGGAFFLLRS